MLRPQERTRCPSWRHSGSSRGVSDQRRLPPKPLASDVIGADRSRSGWRVDRVLERAICVRPDDPVGRTESPVTGLGSHRSGQDGAIQPGVDP